MRSVLFTVLLVACAGQGAAPVAPPAPAVVASAQPVASARLTSCAARPSTVYGREDVVFVIEGEGPPNTSADFELYDERGRSVSKGSVVVPGQLTPAGLASGDFELIVGDGALRCVVTVNRELPRASPMTR